MKDSYPVPEQETDVVIYEPEGRIGYITLNRPEVLNSFSRQSLSELDEALIAAKDDQESRVIILRGNGRSFSAGNDFQQPKEEGWENEDVLDDHQKLTDSIDRYLRIFDFPKPIIAQIHGYCLGIATQMAVMCDLTIVADDAKIGFPSIPVGGGYISPMWSWLIGPKRAKELSFTVGSKISGTTAAEWGYANRSVPADKLEDTVKEMAQEIAKVPSKILKIKKLANNRTMDAQGFRHAIRAGAEFDAMLHFSNPVTKMTSFMREKGMQQAFDAFNSGDFS